MESVSKLHNSIHCRGKRTRIICVFYWPYAYRSNYDYLRPKGDFSIHPSMFICTKKQSYMTQTRQRSRTERSMN